MFGKPTFDFTRGKLRCTLARLSRHVRNTQRQKQQTCQRVVTSFVNRTQHLTPRPGFAPRQQLRGRGRGAFNHAATPSAAQAGPGVADQALRQVVAVHQLQGLTLSAVFGELATQFDAHHGALGCVAASGR